MELTGKNSPIEAISFTSSIMARNPILGTWPHPAVIAPSNFAHKSLCCWSLNLVLGCTHCCVGCYVPDTSAGKQAAGLSALGVTDAHNEWGNYGFLRLWDESEFLRSLAKAEKTRTSDLNPDGNRAVLLSSTTDAYQIFAGPDSTQNRELNSALRQMRRRALELIRDNSTLNVRILTRGPAVRQDFDLFRTFGNRLLLGMSIPSLDNKLIRLYEPHAPAPTRRLSALYEARNQGLSVFVAAAPSYPECTDADIRQTLTAIKDLNPLTIFSEPLNIRGKNVERLEQHALDTGKAIRTGVFQSREEWRRYAIQSLMAVQRVAEELGLLDRLHLWPDVDLLSRDGFLKSRNMALKQANPNHQSSPETKMTENKHYEKVEQWIRKWHNRISEWPK